MSKKHDYPLRYAKYMDINLAYQRPYTAKELMQLGFTRWQVSRAVKSGYLLHLDRGIYKISAMGLEAQDRCRAN